MKKMMHLAFSGIALGFLIALGFSLIYQTTDFYPSSPRFVALFNNRLSATVAATILWALIGLVFGLGSLVFEKANWSTTKQTVIHLIITYCLFTPLAIISGWFPHTWIWIGLFTLIFIGIYTAIWISVMMSERITIAKINQQLSQQRHSK